MLRNGMERIQVIKGFPPHIQLEYGIAKNRPSFLGIHMKPICNFRCVKCFIGEQKDLVGSKEILTTEEIQAILKNAEIAGVKVLGITGAGEPFMDKRIFEVIREANKRGFIIHIPTNSSILDEETVRFLRDNNTTLVLSLDTTNSKSFAKRTRTTEKMYGKVLENIKMAQEIFRGTKVQKEINGKAIEVYRMAIHMTLQKGETEEIDKVKKLADPDTLFSVSPLAEAGFAIGSDLAADEALNKEISEEHIVICHDETNRNGICGFFRYGLDINFDGQLLLDAHAIETRTVFKNIRDFDYDINAAYDYLENEKKDFIKNWLNGFCPVRSEKLSEWIELNTENEVGHG